MWWPSVASASTFMPPKGTEIANQVDGIYAFLLIVSLLSFIILIGGMIVFVVKYKRQTPTDKTAYITHNHTLEFLWSFIPFCIFMFVFAWGWIVYHRMRTVPVDALEVHVLAKQWDWRFVYKNGKEALSSVDNEGKRVPPVMVVPINRPVKLIMGSEKKVPGSKDPNDIPVLHSFFVPAFRIKQDVVPGRYTALWFETDKIGEFTVFCTEFCGAQHSGMAATIKTVGQQEFDSWLAGEAVGGVGAEPLSLADQGRNLFGAKACIGCHSLDGSKMTGPTWKGMFGSQRTFVDGTSAIVDENYIRESILNPTAKVVQGFQPSMPPYAGQVSDDELNAFIEFMKTLAK